MEARRHGVKEKHHVGRADNSAGDCWATGKEVEKKRGGKIYIMCANKRWQKDYSWWEITDCSFAVTHFKSCRCLDWVPACRWMLYNDFAHFLFTSFHKCCHKTEGVPLIGPHNTAWSGFVYVLDLFFRILTVCFSGFFSCWLPRILCGKI